MRSKSELKRLSIQGAFDASSPVNIMDALDILGDIPEELERRLRELLRLGYRAEHEESFDRDDLAEAFHAGWAACAEHSTSPPPQYACSFCEMDRLRRENERYRGIADAQAKLLAELPPSAEQLTMAQMDAATTRAELRVALQSIGSLQAQVDLMGPIYEATLDLHGRSCVTYGICEGCFDRCGDCTPPYGHRRDCAAHDAEERIREGVVRALNAAE